MTTLLCLSLNSVPKPHTQPRQITITRALFLGKILACQKPSISLQVDLLYDALMWFNKKKRKLVFISIQGPLLDGFSAPYPFC